MERFLDINRDFDIFEDAVAEDEFKRQKIYKKRYDPFELDDVDFYSRYRFDKITAQFIIDILNIEEARNNRGLPISVALQVLTTLRFLGRNIHQSDVGDLHGISTTSVGRIIKNISKRIALLFPHFIRFPSSSELIEVKRKFYQISHFPSVIGAIDCTHIRIKCPAGNIGVEMAGHYLNRKNYYSLNVQIVCDADCKILDIVARSRGSKHDARIWSDCQLKLKLESTRNEHSGVLIGDAGYPLSTILLTVVRNPATPKEIRYNKSHKATRAKIECMNGQIKSKFRSIFERLRVDLDTAKNIVVAVAVLHNIAKERNMSYLDLENETVVEPSVFSINPVIPNESSATGRAYRTAFINTNF